MQREEPQRMIIMIKRESQIRKNFHSLIDRPEPVQHSPQFHHEKHEEFVDVYDGDLPVLRICTKSWTVELREFYPDGRSRSDFTIPRPYHSPGFRGLVTTGCWWINQMGVSSQSQTLSIDNRGTEIVFRVEEIVSSGEDGFHKFTLCFDEEFGCYALEFHAVLELLNPSSIEISNFYAYGVGWPNPDMKRFQYTLFSDREGAIRYFNHNPMVPQTPGNMDMEARRVPVGGFMCFGAESTGNPVLEILEAHADSIWFPTCSAYYDEHFMPATPGWNPATGRYRWEFRYRMTSLPAALIDQLRNQAKLLDFRSDNTELDNPAYLRGIRDAGRQVQRFDEYFAFELGKPCHFEHPISPGALIVGQYWSLDPQRFGAARFNRSERALELEGFTPEADIAITTAGPIMRFPKGRGFRFRALVRTTLTPDALAFLELHPILYSFAEIEAFERSISLALTSEWRELIVSVPPMPNRDFIAPRLRLKGQGKAQFKAMFLDYIDQ